MFAEREIVEDDGICRKLEFLSVSRKLVKSVSKKLRKRRIHRSARGEEETANRFSFSCLSLCPRGRASKVGELGDSSTRSSSASEKGKGYKPMFGSEETGICCFSFGKKDRFSRLSNRRELELEESQRDSRMNLSLPDDILEICLMRLPLSSLMNARLVCKKWNYLTTTPLFMMRREGLYQTPWLFVFDAVKYGYGKIHVLDVALDQWHNINAEVLRGRFMYAVASMRDEIFIVGGCSVVTSFGKVLDGSPFKTHKSVLVFTPSTKSWHKVASMKYPRLSPVLGICEVSLDCPIIQSQSNRQDRQFPRTRLGGISDVYEDPQQLSVRSQVESPIRRSDTSSLRDRQRFVLIAVGGLRTSDGPVDYAELYDTISNKWTDIQKLPLDFGFVGSGVVCKATFYVCSGSGKLAGYDIERGFWTVIQTTPSMPRNPEYCSNLVSCNNIRLFMLSVSWCEGDGKIGQKKKAIRKMWELDLMNLAWTEVSTHPDAPIDWNAAFVADKNLIFGVEMYEINGQVLDFSTVCDVSDKAMKWRNVTTNRVAHELDASSFMTKAAVAVHL